MPKKTMDELITDAGKREERQGLFDSLFIDEPNWSHTLEVFDAIPKFVHQHLQKLEKAEVLERSCTHRGRLYEVQIAPAVVKGKNEVFLAYPGKREELVFNALRYLAVQQQVEASIVPYEKGDRPSVSLRFSIHQIRNELKRVGHGYNWTEITEALEILQGARLKIESDGVTIDGGILMSSAGLKDKEGTRQIWFHPLASKAILSGASRGIRYDTLMALKKPLSRWLYMRFCHLTTNAAQTTPLRKGIGLRFTLKEVLEQSGIQGRARKRDNLKIVRQALDELKTSGVAQNDDMGDAWIEDPTREEWTVYPSNRTVSDIITATRMTTARPQDNLTLED
jgi:hypothetical protein